ncbi:TPA: hypothetical protein IAA87_09090 [Candidatus Avigastranaerophilus faecigallinarum]|nr:hypothetical protein [Candidatus Avigastranaerophilus faecigallinarum]
MRNYLILLFCLILASSFVKAEKVIPDPLYLNSEVLDSSKVEEPEKEYAPRTLQEKVREKLHLPPSKKTYYHNIDKSNMPITMDDYYKLSAEKKRKDFIIPEPSFEQNSEIILPDPHYRVVSYNSPPGQRNIDLTKLVAQRTIASPGILSPDNKKMVYTKCFFYPKYSQTSSSAYYIPVKENINDAYEALFKTNVMQGDVNPIVTVGMDYLQEYQFKTLFPIDWSKDSTKIAFKEKIGSNLYETWQTNVIIYDFKSKSWKRLTAVREAIIYWWRQNKHIELKDYLWDIFPIGWDKNNPDRLIVYAYAFTKDKPLFLGTWSIDYNEEKSELISIDSTNVQIDLNGFGLKEIKFEH